MKGEKLRRVHEVRALAAWYNGQVATTEKTSLPKIHENLLPLLVEKHVAIEAVHERAALFFSVGMFFRFDPPLSVEVQIIHPAKAAALDYLGFMLGFSCSNRLVTGADERIVL